MAQTTMKYQVKFPKSEWQKRNCKTVKPPVFTTVQTLPTDALSVKGTIADTTSERRVTLLMVDKRIAGDTEFNERRAICGLIVEETDGRREYIKNAELAARIFDYDGFHDGCNRDCPCLKICGYCGRSDHAENKCPRPIYR